MGFFEYIGRAFMLNLSDYGNLGSDIYINIYLLIFTVALCIGFYLFNFHKRNMFLIVNQLLRHKCKDKESAKSLSAIGLADNFFVRRILSSGGHITKVVRRTDEVEYTYEERQAMSKAKKSTRPRIDTKETLFYIDENKMDRALRIQENYNISPLRTTLLCALLIFFYIGLMCAMPEIVRLLDNIIGSFKSIGQ